MRFALTGTAVSNPIATMNSTGAKKVTIHQRKSSNSINTGTHNTSKTASTRQKSTNSAWLVKAIAAEVNQPAR